MLFYNLYDTAGFFHGLLTTFSGIVLIVSAIVYASSGIPSKFCKMNEALPDKFDVIVIGTGLSESILSGAFSRIGKKVLHLDHSKNYGSNWSSFNLRGFESWIEENNKEVQGPMVDDLESIINPETEELIVLKNIRRTVNQGETVCYLKKEVKKPLDVEMGKGCVMEDTKESQSLNKTHQSGVESTSSEHSPPDSSGSEPPQKDLSKTEQMIDSKTENKETEDDTDTKEVMVEFLIENAGILKKSPEEPSEKADERSREFFYSKWRHYNLDLAPKLMFSRGKLVELLIASNVCRYLEFRNVTSTLTLLGQSDLPQKLVPVPCSRTDIFNSKLVTMVEKRILMRILTICANFEKHPDEYKDHKDRPFTEFLSAKKLSEKLQHFIIHSIAAVNENANTMEGLSASQNFLRSLGRYGNSAFLWTTYGVGELPQAFCRLSAVFGGTFCLARSVQAIVVDKADGRCIGIIDSTGQRIECEHLILNECYAPESCRVPFKNVVSRAIYVTDTSFTEKIGNVSLITIPPTGDILPTRLIEVGPSCCVSPSNHYVVHGLTNAQCEGGILPSPRSQFSSIEKIIFEGTGYAGELSNDSIAQAEEPNVSKERSLPRVLWVAYFNMLSDGVDSANLPTNVLTTNGPGIELGFDEIITEARSLFGAICPDEEFLPRAPNPDEIIYFDQNDEGYSTETNGASSPPQPQEDIGEYQEDETEDAGTGEPSELEESTVATQSVSEKIEGPQEE